MNIPSEQPEPALIQRWRRDARRRGLRTRLTQPLPLGVFSVTVPVAAASLLMGGLAGAVLSLVAGVVTISAMVANRSQPRALEAPVTALLERGSLTAGVLPEDIGCHELRGRYVTIVRKRERLEELVASATGLAPGLTGVLEACDELVVEAGELTARANELDAYLRQAVDMARGERATELRWRACASTDSGAREAYLKAAVQAEQNEKLVAEMYGTRECLTARLEAIETQLDAAAARVVLMRSAMDAPQLSDGSSDDLDLMESSIREITTH